MMTESPVRLGLFGACSTGKFLVSRAGRYTMHRPEIQIGDSGLLASELTWKVTELGGISVDTQDSEPC